MITDVLQTFPLMAGSPENLKRGKNLLTGAASGEGGSFSDLFAKLLPGSSQKMLTGDFKNNAFFDFASIKGDKETSLVSILLSGLGSGDLSPSEAKVDAAGLKLFERLLKSLGFDDEAVAGFMSELTGAGSMDEMSLSTFLIKINEFLKSGQTHDELDESSLPYIESILAGMGVRPDEVENLLSGVRGDRGGLDLQDLIDGLQKILREKSDASKDVLLTASRAGQALLKGAGITETGEGLLTLQDFIKGLRQIERNKSASKGGGDDPVNIARSFGESVHNASSDRSEHALFNAGNNLLNNHSFQKHQQKLEEKFNTGKSEGQNFTDQKAAGRVVSFKEGQELAGDKNFTSLLSKKAKENSGQSLRTGITPENLIARTETQTFRTPTEKPLPSYLANQVGRRIALAANKGETEIRFQIKPPEMGRLQINLEFSKDGMKVGIIAEKSATREMLVSGTGELRSILADQGIRLEKVQVDVSGNFQQSMSDAGRGSGNSAGKDNNSGKNDTLFEQTRADENSILEAEPFFREDSGRLNLFV